jgi:hypothetical protein
MLLVLADCNAVPRLNAYDYVKRAAVLPHRGKRSASGEPLNGRQIWVRGLGWGSNLAAR